MRRTLFTILITTLAFSIGLVNAKIEFPWFWRKKPSNVPSNDAPGGGHSSSPVNDDGNGRGRNFAPVYDAMGIASNYLVCNNKNAYNKREAYAVVHESLRLKKSKKFVTAGCEALHVCRRYPSDFTPRGFSFKLKGPYTAFPIQPNEELYKGGRLPVGDLVIYGEKNYVAGIVQPGFRGYTKCLLDESYVPGSPGFFQKMKSKYRYWRGIP